MASDLERIVAAVKRIAQQAAVKQSALTAKKQRGGVAKNIGTGSTKSDENDTTGDSDDDSTGNDNDGSDGSTTSGIPSNNYLGDHVDMLEDVTDCDTGQALNINFSGTWTAPDGWDSLTEGPEDETWEYGYYWTWSVWYPPSTIYGEGVAESAAAADAACSAIVGSACTYCQEAYAASGTHASVQTQTGYKAPWVTAKCVAYTDEELEDAPTENPGLTSWPSDSTAQLALKSGQFVGNSMDPDAGDYLSPVSSIYVCDDDGQKMEIIPTYDGGFITRPVDPDSDDNATLDGGTVYRYNSSGDSLGSIDESRIDAYRVDTSSF